MWRMSALELKSQVKGQTLCNRWRPNEDICLIEPEAENWKIRETLKT